MAEGNKGKPLVLFITYVDIDKRSSGSVVRPSKMMAAFRQLGCEMKLLTGSQEIHDRKTRRAAVESVSRWLDTNRPDICYVESPVYPILWDFDRALLRKIHALGIPLAYYYRDFHRRFPQLFPPRRSFSGRIKDLWLNHLQKKTDRLLRVCDIVYFPTPWVAEIFDYADCRALPPAGEELEPVPTPEGRTCIYVGGLTNHYGGEMLLRAFALLNREKTEYPLILVCREREWAAMPQEYAAAPWLELHHASGPELDALYRRAGAALLVPKMPNEYNDRTVSVKLYECLNYSLPMVYVKCIATHDFVSRSGFGIGTDYSPESFAAGVREMFSDSAAYAARREAAHRTLLSGNRWIDRAQQVIHDLAEVKKA